MTEAALQVAPPQLHLRHLWSPATVEPLVLLHGWGADSTIFDGVAALLAESRDIILVDLPGFGGSEPWPEMDSAELLSDLLAALANQLPQRFNLLGWSLGGMLATAFCHRFPGRVNKLVTLASNACFVAVDDWRQAMPLKTFRQFCDFFAQSPSACLKQFAGLEAQGDERQRQLLKTLRPFSRAATSSGWSSGLALLGEMDNRAALAGLTAPGLHLFGAGDALVPAVAASRIAALNPGQTVEVLPGLCHALHLSAPQKITARVNRFLADKTAAAERLDKKQVAASFSRAAHSYDGAAAFQRRVADRVLSLVPTPTAAGSSPRQVLDLGCGTGYLCAGVRRRFADSHLTALDLAPGMLAYARAHRPVADCWLRGDAEALPLPSDSLDLVVSSLTYQWCERPQQWGAELRRVLKPDGVAVFSTFGPETLTELSTAWQAVDDLVHVNRFIDVAILRQQLSAAGLQCELFIEQHRLSYPDLKTLMRELKAIGAHNLNSGRNAALTGRRRLRQLTEAYEQFRGDDGQLPASYQVVYGVAKREI